MIEIKGLCKSFKGVPVLNGLDLVIEDDQTMTVIGPSGCGKSVLLKHILGLLHPDSGSIIIDGEDITHYSEKQFYHVREKFGMLFQAAALFESLTVLDNVGLWLKEHTKTPEGEIQAKAEKILGMVGLRQIGDKRPSELSGGMKKRVGLARAIVNDPRYVLYDEPTTGLDPIMSDIITDLILNVRKELKNTAVVVTHDMASVYKVADRIAMMHQGKIVFLGTPEEIKNTDNALAQQFIHGKSQGPIRL